MAGGRCADHWPHAWPSPEPVTLTLYSGQLSLPVRPPRPDEDARVTFAPPEAAPVMEREILREENA